MWHTQFLKCTSRDSFLAMWTQYDHNSVVFISEHRWGGAASEQRGWDREKQQQHNVTGRLCAVWKARWFWFVGDKREEVYMINSEYSLNIIKLNVLLVGAKLRVVICLEYFFNMVTSSHGCGFILFTCSLVWWERNRIRPWYFSVDCYNIVSVVMNFCLFFLCHAFISENRWGEAA